jgi:hypothetical protein
MDKREAPSLIFDAQRENHLLSPRCHSKEK